MTQHFATTINPALVLELATVEVVAADGSTIRVAPRPPDKTPVLVRAAPSNDDLPATTCDASGYIEYEADDTVPSIFLSVDDWDTVIGPIDSAERSAAAGSAGQVAAAARADAADARSLASTANSNAGSALDRADEALRLVEQVGPSTPGAVTWDQLQDKPTDLMRTGQGMKFVRQSGTGYTKPPGYDHYSYGGTADPGSLAGEYELWYRPRPATP